MKRASNMKMTLNMMTASNRKTTQMWKRTQIWRQPQWEQTKPVLPNQFYQTKHTKLNKIYQTKPSKATKEKQYTSINQVNLANSEPVIWILSKPNKFLALRLAQLSLSFLYHWVPFPVWTTDNISGSISVVPWLLRWEVIKKKFW